MLRGCRLKIHIVRSVLLSLSLLQFKFALVIMGRPQFINEESEFLMNLQEFKNHPNQGRFESISFKAS